MRFLLREHALRGDAKSLAMVEKTLEAMRLGGIWDQVGFGFHRYSTDDKWLVPHFEKMLYDQALQMMAYTEAWQVSARPLWSATIEGIATYVLRDMTAPEGGFYSAEDADSEGVEGRFYVWSLEQLEAVLGETDAKFYADVYGCSERGTFRMRPPGVGQVSTSRTSVCPWSNSPLVLEILSGSWPGWKPFASSSSPLAKRVCIPSKTTRS